MTICERTTPKSVSSAQTEMPPRIPMIVASCAEQGTPRARSVIAMRRSFGVPRILVVMVAMVSQPSPRIMGNTALPLRPIERNSRSLKMAAAGCSRRCLQGSRTRGRTW